MNKKKRNARHLNTSFHVSFLVTFPILLIVAILLFSFSLWKATNDQKMIARNMRARMYEQPSREGVIFYRVVQDDSLEEIAETFEVTPETILWANDIPDETISPSMIITIPPADGIVHEVQTGQTTQGIADMYKTNPEKIQNFPFNQFIDEEKNIPVIGQILMVPDGKKESESKDVLGEFLKRFGL